MRNRWFIALAAIGLHISIGSVYAWSVLTRPIMADMGFTLSRAFLDPLQKKLVLRKVALSLCYSG